MGMGRSKNGYRWQGCLLYCIVLVLLLVGTGCGGQEGLFFVTRVVDGDTIVVEINNRQETVRLIGVDTPETKKPNTPVEPYGPEATAFTKGIVEGKRVRLELDVQERDRYGRLLAYVYLPDGTFLNAELLRQGYARVLTIPPNVRYAEMFLALEREARENNRGLWGLELTPGTDTADAPSVTVTEPSDQTVSSGKALIKGNINKKGERIYHLPGGQYYDQTVADEWFVTEEEAQAAGYRRSQR